MKAQEFKYDIIEVYPLTDLYKFEEHRRLRVFFHKGTTCTNPDCNVEGTQLALGRAKNGSLHVDVYTDDFYPLTVDHEQPRSKGGSDDLSNLNPMCYRCNQLKADKVEGEIYTKPVSNKLTSKDFVKGMSGDVPVFKRRKNKFVCLGFVEKLVTNPHTGLLSFMVSGNPTSMYNVNQAYVQR